MVAMLRRFTPALILLLIFSLSYAGIPLKIDYQGRLTDTGGEPLSDTTVNIVFSIYTDSVGGSQVWSSGARPVQITDGLFNYTLGSHVTLHSAYISMNSENRFYDPQRHPPKIHVFRRLPGFSPSGQPILQEGH